MIPLSRVRPTQKNGGYIGVALKNADFWAKNAVFGSKSIFLEIIQFFVTIMIGHQKVNIFV